MKQRNKYKARGKSHEIIYSSDKTSSREYNYFKLF